MVNYWAIAAVNYWVDEHTWIVWIDMDARYYARVKRLTANSYAVVTFRPKRTEIKLIRRATGPWRAYYPWGRGIRFCGTTPRSCPGPYAAGAWSLLFNYTYFD